MAITRYALRKPSYSPWRDLADVQNRLTGFFDDIPVGRRSWAPSVNVTETADALTLTAELPGLTEDSLSIELENNVLTLSGEKSEHVTEEDEELRYHVVERRYGSFRRSFSLPRTVKSDDIAATFENGVLTVSLPKAPEAKGRAIEISKK